MHDALPTLKEPRHSRHFVTYHPSEGIKKRSRENNQGSVQTVKIRAVCSDCNNGWMSRLETEVRPFLEPLVKGEPVALDHEQMMVIARWVALKCIILESGVPTESLTPLADRIALKSTGTIPPYCHVYVANHDNPVGVGMLRHSHAIALSSSGPSPPLDGMHKNIHTVTFFAGRIFVHAIIARIDDFALERKVMFPALYTSSRIWPPDHYELVWPREPIFTTKQVETFADSLSLYLNAVKTHWAAPP
jgi:hypothetical protein